jgi:hypothetical protein
MNNILLILTVILSVIVLGLILAHILLTASKNKKGEKK